MKIVFLSDIHGNKYALSSFIAEMKLSKPDKIIFCGDIFGYYYYQNEIIDSFKENNIKMLLGNHDQYFLDILDGNADIDDLINKYGNSYNDIESRITSENIELLKSLSPSYDFVIDNYKIGIFHGSPYNPLNGRIYPDTEITETKLYEDYDFIILGHTHHKMVKKIKSTVILNPGSIGQQRDGKGASYLELDTITGEYEFKVIDFDIGRLIEDIDFYDQGNLKLKDVLFRKSL